MADDDKKQSGQNNQNEIKINESWDPNPPKDISDFNDFNFDTSDDDSE